MAYVKTSIIKKYTPTFTESTFDLSEGIVGVNEINDILKITIACDGPRTLASPVTGWTTELNTTYAGQIGLIVLTRRATAANESLPSITISATDDIAVTYEVIYGCPTTGAYVGNTSTNTNTTDTPTWTSISYSANSTVLFLACIDAARTFTDDTLSVGQQINEANGTGSTAFSGKKFFTSAGSTGSVTAEINASDQWICYAIEFLDNGSAEKPLEFANKPATRNTLTLDTTSTWRDLLTNAQVDHTDGTSIASYTTTFDANTDVNPATDQITITGHPYPSNNGYVVRADANGNTLPTGLTDGAYYYVDYVDANTIRLMLCPDKITVNTSAEIYEQGVSTMTDITAVGSGTCRLEACGFMNIYNSGISLLQNPQNADVGFNYQGVGLTFTTPRDMTGETFLIPLTSITNAQEGTWITFIDSAGDFKTWKVGNKTYGLATQNPVIIDPTNTTNATVYEYGTFDVTSVKSIVASTTYSSSSGRGTWVFDYLGGKYMLVPEVIMGTGTTKGVWDEIYNELNFYTPYTSQQSVNSQIIFKTSIKIGDGTNDVAMMDGAKAIAFSEPSNGVSSLRENYNNNGVYFNLTPGSSIDFSKQLYSSGDVFYFNTEATSSPSATLQVRNTTFNNGSISVRTNNDLRASSFSGCQEIQADGAEFLNTSITNTQAGATEAAISFASNDTLEGAEIDVTGTSAGYHIELGTAVTAFTLTDVTFTGTPGTDKIHVLATTGTVTITLSGSTSLVAADVTSEGATVVIASSPVTLEVNNVYTGSEPTNYVRCRIEAAAGGPESVGTALLNKEAQTAVGDGTYKATESYSFAGIQPVIIRARYKGFLPFESTGTITSNGLTVTAVWQVDPNYT